MTLCAFFLPFKNGKLTFLYLGKFCRSSLIACFWSVYWSWYNFASIIFYFLLCARLVISWKLGPFIEVYAFSFSASFSWNVFILLCIGKFSIILEMLACFFWSYSSDLLCFASKTWDRKFLSLSPMVLCSNLLFCLCSKTSISYIFLRLSFFSLSSWTFYLSASL